MGFFDKAWQVSKDLGTTFVEATNKEANKIREIKQSYEEKSDQDLLRIVHGKGFSGSTQQQKGIAFGILKSRGFSLEEVNSYKN